MKQGIVYPIIKFLFGLYMIWLGVFYLQPTQIEMNKTYLTGSIDKFEIGVSQVFPLISDSIPQLIKKFSAQVTQHIDLTYLKKNSSEILHIQCFMLILGGFLCCMGYSLSSSVLLIGIFIDLIFIHNYYYYRDEKLKVNVLKMLAIFGGILHII